MVTKNEVRFTVPGEPVGKGRPRLSSRNGFAHAYTPAGTRKYEAMVRKLAGEEMERQGLAVTELPVYVSIAARYAIPKRHLASDGSLRSHKAGTKLAGELDAMLNRQLYSQYKTAPTEEQREQARKEYLDRRGVPQSYRWTTPPWEL